jgi:uncharacterized protein YecE (DUF72 family)
MPDAPQDPLVLQSPSEAIGTEYRVGCSSWLDPSLLAAGTFYPDPQMTAEDRLRWYARFFDCVEVNATYYALPSYRNSQVWAERTPPGFEFAIKAYALMTGHHPKADRLPKELKALLPPQLPTNARGEIDRKHFPTEALDLCFGWFRDALAPLDEAGKLSYILFQLAPWVGYSPKALDYLASLPERLPAWRLAIEFRNPSWIPKRTEEMLRFLVDHGLAYVAVDCPWQPLIPAATRGDLAVFRFHGRNVKGWEAQQKGQQPTVAEKYDYCYTPEELQELAGGVRKFHGKARRVYAKFNNNNWDYPVRNALAFRRLLGQAVPDLEASRGEYQPPSGRSRRRAQLPFLPRVEKPQPDQNPNL